MLDLNHGSGPLIKPAGWTDAATIGDKILAHIDAGLERQRGEEKPRPYIGASELGEDCLRKLYYSATKAARPPFTGGKLRIFQMGHRFEELMVEWIRAAGFTLLEKSPRTGRQFEFTTGKDRIRGHCDGVITAGPVIASAPPYPWLWENKALKAKFWNALVKDGLRKFDSKYWAQAHLYMGYFELDFCLFTAVNKDTAEIYFELIQYQVREAQKYSDRGVDLIRAVDTGQVPARISHDPKFFKCLWCDYRESVCWKGEA